MKKKVISIPGKIKKGKIYIPFTGETFINVNTLPSEKEIEDIIFRIKPFLTEGTLNLLAKAIHKRLRGKK